MAVGLDLSCLHSVVRNISEDGAKRYGFLPPHGRRLEANEEFVVFGSIYDAIVPFERSGARRNIVAFENALRRGDLEIVSTPAPILENQHGHTKMVILTNDNTLSAVDPCWETSLSTSDDADFN